MTMQKNSIKNAHIDLVAKRLFIPATALISGQVSGASTVLTSGLGSGTPNLVELGTSGIGALKLAATTDEIDWLWIPGDLDNRFRILVRYLWTSDYGTASGTARFDTLYTVVAAGAALTQGATALNTLPGASTKTAATARAIYWSKYGQINPLATGAQAGQTLNQSTIAIAFDLKVGAVTGITIASDFVYVIGVELVYTPRITFGRSTREARLLADGLHSSVELDVANDI
jgi:hypothetical protein